MPNRIDVLAGELEALRSEIADLDSTTEPTDEQVSRMDAALAEHDAKKAEFETLSERAAKVEAVRAASFTAPTNNERAFHAPQVMQRNDPFANLDGVRAGYVDATDMVARAKSAIEAVNKDGDLDDSGAERATRLAKSAAVARHLLLTGSPEYRADFEDYVRNPLARRTYASLTAANGGVLVPFNLDPTIVITNDGATNPFRAISRVEVGTTDDWNGVTSAGVTAEWLAEGAEADDKTPTFAQPTITAHKATAFVAASYEVLGDSNLAEQLPRLIADAKDRLEAAAFATGSGTGQPKGVVTAASTSVALVFAATTSSFVLADLYKVANAVPPRHRSRMSWVANYAIYNHIRQFDTSGGAALWEYLAADQPGLLLGRPAYESSAMAGTLTTSSFSILAGDFSEYLIYDRLGLTLLYEPIMKGVTTGRPTGQGGWMAYWRVGADAINPNAFAMLKLAAA
jgi:HK97 family phage major capsid protein